MPREAGRSMMTLLGVLVFLGTTSCGPPRVTSSEATSATGAVAGEDLEPQPAEQTDSEQGVAREVVTEPSGAKTLSIGTARPVLDSGDNKVPQCLADVRKAYHSLKRGDLVLSERLLEKSLVECPSYAPAHYDLAWIHIARGDDEAALSALEKALEANYIRYADYLRKDKTFEPLRRSKRWARFEVEIERIRNDWASALSEPGAFVLLGHDDLRAVHIFDDDRNLTKERAPVGTVSRARGQLFYLHRSSGRLLPVSRDRRVGGFLVDRERRKVHLYSWKRLKVSHGYMYETHPVGVEYLPEEGWLSKVSLSTLDLAKLSLSEPMSLGGDYGLKRLARCGDRLIVAGASNDGTPFEEVTPEGLRPLSDMVLADFDRCDDEIAVVGPRLDPMLMRRRCEDLPSGASAKAERLCLRRKNLYHPFRQLEGPHAELLLDGPAIVQLEATPAKRVDPPAVASPRGLTCKTIVNARRVSKAEIKGFHCGVSDVAVQGRYAFVASNICGVMIWDFADPAEPQRVGLLYTGSRAYTVAIKGRHLLVGDGGGLDVVDVSNPVVSESFPRSPSHLASTRPWDEFHVWDMVIRDDTAYVASRGMGLHMFDISDWASPRYLSKVAGAGNVQKLVIEGQQLRLRNQGEFGWKAVPDSLVDISNPRTPRVVKKVGRRPMQPVVVTHSHEFVATSKGLEVRELRGGDEKTKVAFVKLGGSPRAIAVEGHHAYIASNPTWLHVVELCPAD